MEMIVALTGLLRGVSAVIHVHGTAERRAKVSLTPVSVLREEAPRKKGSPLASQPYVDF